MQALVEHTHAQMTPPVSCPPRTQSLGIVPRCAAWAAGFPVPGQAGGPGAGGSRGAGGLLGGPGAAAQLQLQQQGGEVDAEAAEELLLKLAKLLAALAGEVMDALKRVENGRCLVCLGLV